MANVEYYELTARQMGRALGALEKILDKGLAHARAKKVDPPEVFLQQRLVIDQFSLLRQVQITCDIAKYACARLTGKEAPKHPDTEMTFTQLQSRIQSVTQYLTTFKPEDFNGAEKRQVTQPWMEGKFLTGDQFLTRLAIPNFYFHMTTAYSILRANGVDVGKSDFIVELPWKDL